MVRAFPWARIPFVLALVGSAGSILATGIGRPPAGWVLLVLGGVLVGSITAGVFLMSAGLFARPVLGADPRRSAGRLALTFDDGPDPKETRRILDLLDQHGHRATFFVIGARAAQHPEVLDEIVRRGHALGNHSFAHARSTATFSVSRLVHDLSHAQQLLARAEGRAPRWFRPPAGVLSPRVTAAAQKVEVELVGWTATARDGIVTTVERALVRLTRKARPGAILVLHDGVERGDRRPIAAEVLGRLIETLSERDLKSVTLDELLLELPKSRKS